MITAEEERALRKTISNLMDAQEATAKNVGALMRIIGELQARIERLEKPRPHVLSMPEGLALPLKGH